MIGLDFEKECIIEIVMIVIDKDLNILVEGFVFVIK